MSATGRLPVPDEKPFDSHGEGKASKTREIWLAGGWREVAVWNRDQIPLGGTVAGPAVIEEKYPDLGEPAAFACSNRICSYPLFSAEELAATVKQMAKLKPSRAASN